MEQQLSPAWLDNFWRKLFPGQIPERLTVAEALQDGEFELEDHKLVTVDTGHSDPCGGLIRRIPGVKF